MTLTRNPKGMEKLKQALAKKLETVGDRGVDLIKNNVHIDTGRMQASVRRTDAAITPDKIEVTLIVGGTVEEGVYREEGLPRLVDYSSIEELRHPQIRAKIPEYLQAVREEFK